MKRTAFTPSRAAAVDNSGTRIALVGERHVECVQLDGSTSVPLETTGQRLIDVAVSGDGDWVAASATSGQVLVWRFGREKPAARLAGHRNPIASVQFARDSALLMTSSTDVGVRLWDLSELNVPRRELEERVQAAYRLTLEQAISSLSAYQNIP